MGRGGCRVFVALGLVGGLLTVQDLAAGEGDPGGTASVVPTTSDRAAAGELTPFTPLSLIRHKGARAAVRRAAAGAMERLRRPECEAVFSVFADPAGSPLDEKLKAQGQTGRQFFGMVVYADGAGLARCNDRHLVALTVPGSRVVYICARQFSELAFRRPVHAEAVLIHEALHSLGLGENPPTPREITDRVFARCAP